MSWNLPLLAQHATTIPDNNDLLVTLIQHGVTDNLPQEHLMQLLQLQDIEILEIHTQITQLQEWLTQVPHNATLMVTPHIPIIGTTSMACINICRRNRSFIFHSNYKTNSRLCCHRRYLSHPPHQWKTVSKIWRKHHLPRRPSWNR